MDYLPEFVRKISTHMDYVGQRRAERCFQVIILGFGVLGFCLGYMTQQLSLAVYTVGAGFAVACLVILPPWAFFRSNPLHWQKVKQNGASTSTSAGSSVKSPDSKTKKKK